MDFIPPHIFFGPHMMPRPTFLAPATTLLSLLLEAGLACAKAGILAVMVMDANKNRAVFFISDLPGIMNWRLADYRVRKPICKRKCF